MKSFVCIALVAAILSVALASPAGNAAATSSVQEAQAEQNQQAAYDLTRFRKSAYGAAPSIPAPPCPKNYLFSCQPNLAPVACASPAAASYGSAGAYSAPIPAYVAPLPAGYAGMGFNPNQYYQY
ncbi:PREDICTED: vitelline membrane protein Vm26Aa-like [Rhagoletis zephyria]|uniref:vitelline membrane protein Vm26Aa-like n=1 Tax=Rhagoletis zephyria TaxID=28612 RepID=UPI0008118937|nr:PREDICTED: vitelline membrane protein Vm26Aa-like [Rhagoletis zephyria]